MWKREREGGGERENLRVIPRHDIAGREVDERSLPPRRVAALRQRQLHHLLVVFFDPACEGEGEDEEGGNHMREEMEREN